MASSVSPSSPTTTAQPTKRTHDEAELSETGVDSGKTEAPPSTLESEPPAKVPATDSGKLNSSVSNCGDAKENPKAAKDTESPSTVIPPTASGDTSAQVDVSKKKDAVSSTPTEAAATSDPCHTPNSKSEEI